MTKPLSRDFNVRFLAISTVFVLVFTPLLARGRAGGDQSEVILEVRDFWESGLGVSAWLDRVSANPDLHGVLYHHFGWFIVQNFYYSLFKAAFSAFGFSSAALFDACLSLPETALVLIGMCLAVKYLIRREGLSTGAAITVATGMFCGGTLIFQLHGGTVECAMIFLMMVRLWASASSGEVLSLRRAAAVAVIDAALIAFKAYSLVFILPLAITTPWRRPGGRRAALAYGLILAGLVSAWLLVKAQIPVNVQGYYKVLFSLPSTPAEAVIRVGELLMSPYTGIVWAAPLCFLALAARRERLPLALAKMAGIMSILATLSLFWFWFDGEGHRYVAPFVVSLVPEVGCGAARLARTWRKIWLAFPVAVTLFLPAADIWPRWLPVYSVNEDQMPPLPMDIDSSGMLDINDYELAPPLFAWRIVFAEMRGTEQLTLHPYGRAVVLPLRSVFPFTGVSRLIFVLDRHQQEFPEAIGVLQSLHAESPSLWRAVRWGALSVLSLVLVWATRQAMADDGLNGPRTLTRLIDNRQCDRLRGAK